MALPPHVRMIRARGREYFYFQPFRGTKDERPRVALPGLPTLPNGEPNPSWWSAYRAASGTEPARPSAGTFAALVLEWAGAEGRRGSTEWEATASGTKLNRRRHLKRILDAWGELAVRDVKPKHVLDLRDAWRDTPAEANNIIRTLSAMLAWSVPRDWRNDNPCEHVPKLAGGDPYAAWHEGAIQSARELMVPQMWWSVALALYTGQRVGDVLGMTWRDFDAGTINVVQEKTGTKVWIPVHRDLAAVLSAVPRLSTRILTGGKGRPWTSDGFGTQWHKQMEAVRLITGEFEGLVFHGLRKSAVTTLLEAGCTTAEVHAITGQSLEMIQHYAADLDKKRLAKSAISKWEAHRP